MAEEWGWELVVVQVVVSDDRANLSLKIPAKKIISK
jgi:hypothetical protein